MTQALARDTAPTTTPAEPANLTAAQETAVRALLEGASVPSAARQADVARQTVSRWRREDPAFRAALAAGWRELRFLTYQRLIGLAEQALDTLRDVLLEAPDSRSRVRAAELILQHVGDRLKPTPREVSDYYLDAAAQGEAEDVLWRYEANSIDPAWVPRPKMKKG